VSLRGGAPGAMTQPPSTSTAAARKEENRVKFRLRYNSNKRLNPFDPP
jgi:hypothetical protein